MSLLKSSLWGQFNSILVVDDDNVLLSFLKDILEEEGFDVTTFSNAKEALRTLEANVFSVAIIDINMPGLSGLEVLKELKNNKSQTKVIINTGTKSLEMAKQALNHGAFAYVEKFEDPETLLNFVLMALKEQLYESAKELKQEEQFQKIDEREYNHLSEVLIENSREGIVLIKDGHCIFSNPAVSAIFDMERRNFSEKPVDQLLPLQVFFPDRYSNKYEGKISTAKGTQRFLTVTRKYVTFRGEACSLLAIKDNTEMMNLQAEEHAGLWAGYVQRWTEYEKLLVERFSKFFPGSGNIQDKAKKESFHQILEMQLREIHPVDLREIIQTETAEFGNNLKLSLGKWQDISVKVDSYLVTLMVSHLCRDILRQACPARLKTNLQLLTDKAVRWVMDFSPLENPLPDISHAMLVFKKVCLFHGFKHQNFFNNRCFSLTVEIENI